MKYTDNKKANSVIRIKNIEVLKSKGFEESGIYSRSGVLEFRELETKSIVVFGVRSNISGKKATKYFTLKKDYKDKDVAQKECFILAKIMNLEKI